MPEMTKKLDHFTATILAQATAETERTLEDLKAKRDAAHAAAEDRILLETYNYIHAEVARIKAENGRRISRHMLENKRALYLRRGEISREVFGLVREKIAAYVQTDAYYLQLADLYRDSLKKLAQAEDIKVYLRAQDLPLSARLQAAAPDTAVQFLEGDFYQGGLIAESLSLGLRLDASFDSAVAALDGHFAELFGISVSDLSDD